MNIIVKILKEKKRKPWDIYGFLIFSMSSTRFSLHENHLTSTESICLNACIQTIFKYHVNRSWRKKTPTNVEWLVTLFPTNTAMGKHPIYLFVLDALHWPRWLHQSSNNTVGLPIFFPGLAGVEWSRISPSYSSAFEIPKWYGMFAHLHIEHVFGSI